MFRAALAGSSARRFFAAHAQSCLGTGLANLALPLLAYDRFGSPWAVSAVLLPDLLPAILLGPLLGALVDRVGWRRCAAAADLLRAIAFVIVVAANSLPQMIVGATLAGLGTALFHPAAMAGLPQLAPGERRGAAMGLFGALDDLGLDDRPRGGRRPARDHRRGHAARDQRGHLRDLRAADPLASAARGDRAAASSGAPTLRSLLDAARTGVREITARPEIRALLSSSTGVVSCIGVTSVGEVVLARQTLGVGGSGLAVMVTAGGIGTVLGSLSTHFTAAGPWPWRRAYLIGLFAMACELLLCALLPSFWLVVPALALGGFGNGLALVHDRMLLADATPEELHGRLFAFQRTCISLAFAVSFVTAGALIALGGVRLAFLACGLMLIAVIVLAVPRLRVAWPTPARRAPAVSDALAYSAPGEIAQLVEHTTENRGVPGSSPGLAIPPRAA